MAWEGPYLDRITQLRSEELAAIRKRCDCGPGLHFGWAGHAGAVVTVFPCAVQADTLPHAPLAANAPSQLLSMVNSSVFNTGA
jgi:hypothetical protein